MVMFFGVAAVVVDLGRVYVEQNRVREATEAAAIAAGQELGRRISTSDGNDMTEYYVKEAAINYARRNGLNLQWNNIVVTNDRVYITGVEDVDYSFAKVLGFDKKTVGANAVAKVNADGSVSVIKRDRYNVMPWAMPLGVVHEPYNVLTRNASVTNVTDLTPGTEYILKLGGGVQAGGIYYPVGTQVLIPMGGTPGNYDQWALGFKRAYGLAVWLAGHGHPVKWLLGYRGGSFMFDLDTDLMRTLGAMKLSGGGEFGDAGIFVDPAYFQWVRYEVHSDVTDIINQTTSMIVVDKAPRIGVYSSGEDAVTRTMLDAGINYTIFYDSEIRAGCLANYDWLHLHHEDFTGGGSNGGAEVPYITITDEIDNPTEGPVGGVIKVRGSGFIDYYNGKRNIKIWFHNTQEYLTDTSRYYNDYVHPDHMMVDADDNARFEVAITVPPLPDGTYKVYAQVVDEYTNYPEYTIVGSSVRPHITITDEVGDPKEGPYGGHIKIEGSSCGPNSSNIVVKFDGVIQTISGTTSKYPDDGVTSDGFIISTPGGSFEVEIPVPTTGYPDGTYEVYAQIEGAKSNIEIYTIQNYLHPQISVHDRIGDPLKGPDGEVITVSGSEYRGNFAGVRVKFAGTDMSVTDTTTYPNDRVVGYYDITTDENGKWEVMFRAPTLPIGNYQIYTEHTDPNTGNIVRSNVVSYELQDSSNMTSEIYIHDASGNPLSGEVGDLVTVEGYYFNIHPDDIKLWFTGPGTSPIHLVATDTATYSGDSVSSDGLVINSDSSNGRFEVTFQVPDVGSGTYEIKAQYNGGTLYTLPANYVVAPELRTIIVRDDSAPYNNGEAGVILTIEGGGFTPNVSGLQIYFGGQVMIPWDTATYSGDSCSGTMITANANGSFEVQFRTPYWPEGDYQLQIIGSGIDCSSIFTYTLSMAENFWTSKLSDFSTDDNAFVVSDTLYVKALNTRINQSMLAHAYMTVTDVYYGVKRKTINLTPIGDFQFTGSVPWNSIPSVHNGDWELHFFIEDASGNKYEPTTVVHLTGVANVAEGAIISRRSDYSTDDVPLKTSERQYFKIQSPNVDYSDMKKAYFRFCSQQSYVDHGMNSTIENTGEQNYTNNWDGTFTGNYKCPSPHQHYGDYVVKQYIEDNAGRKYNHMRNVAFFSWYSRRSYVSSYQFYDYETSNFYRYGDIRGRTFCRGTDNRVVPMVNYLDMKRNNYRYKKYKSGYDPYTPYYDLTNDGNMIFHYQENLGPHQNGTRYYKFKWFSYIKDRDNHYFYDNKYFNLRNTVTENFLWQIHYKYAREGWSFKDSIAWFIGKHVREFVAMIDDESVIRENHVCFSNDGIFVDGKQDILSPHYYDGPRYVDGDEPVTEPKYIAAIFQREPSESRLDEDLQRLIKEYKMAPPDSPNWFTRNEKVDRDSNKNKLSKWCSWFGNAAHAAYRGRYDIVHAIRDFVVNGGYMFCMCMQPKQ